MFDKKLFFKKSKKSIDKRQSIVYNEYIPGTKQRKEVNQMNAIEHRKNYTAVIINLYSPNRKVYRIYDLGIHGYAVMFNGCVILRTYSIVEAETYCLGCPLLK